MECSLHRSPDDTDAGETSVPLYAEGSQAAVEAFRQDWVCRNLVTSDEGKC